MISIIYSTHKDKNFNEVFKNHLKNTIGIDSYEILQYENFNKFSLSQIYNRGISESKFDIVVCCHNDIKLEKGWGKKLIDDFKKNESFGIIGKAGSHFFPKSGIYWEEMGRTMVGQVYHHPPDKKKWLSRYSPRFEFLIPVVTIDGLFISFNKRKVKHFFDESFGKFHFYDHGFCIPNFLDGVKIGVTSSFEITHESIGQPNEEFFVSKDKFLEKYSDKLPLEILPEEIFFKKIDEKPIKNVGKVAIVILTKSKLDLLFNCIESFLQNSNSSLFEIFIADTGSNENEKNEIKKFIYEKKGLCHITLIEYDYYHFGKINNDVVKNHISNDFEFLLFCNNDIKILNDVVGGMLKTFKTTGKTGTVGCRLHFENNTVQHAGIFIGVTTKQKFIISHSGLKSNYNFGTGVTKVIGNTAALMMIRKNTFEKMGMFSEKYISCFEDAELNLKLICNGYENYYDSNLVAYHYESQTRKLDPNYNLDLRKDFDNNFLPFLEQNFLKIKPYLILVN